MRPIVLAIATVCLLSLDLSSADAACRRPVLRAVGRVVVGAGRVTRRVGRVTLRGAARVVAPRAVGRARLCR